MKRVAIPAVLVVTCGLFIAQVQAEEAPAPKQEAPQSPSATVKVGQQTFEPNLANGKAIYETCAVCHSPQGWGTPSGRYPQLAGQHPNVTVKQLHDIREGNRDNPTMYPFTLNNILPTEQDFADVGAYIASLKMNPNNTTGPGVDLDLGGKLYRENCVECHGEHGEGKNSEAYPRIQGQHYHYLLRQMYWIQSGKRRNANQEMVKQIHRFTGREINAVIDFTSRLKPDPKMVAESQQYWNPDFSRGFQSVPNSAHGEVSFGGGFASESATRTGAPPPPAPPGFGEMPPPPPGFGMPPPPPGFETPVAK